MTRQQRRAAERQLQKLAKKHQKEVEQHLKRKAVYNHYIQFEDKLEELRRQNADEETLELYEGMRHLAYSAYVNIDLHSILHGKTRDTKDSFKLVEVPYRQYEYFLEEKVFCLYIKEKSEFFSGDFEITANGFQRVRFTVEDFEKLTEEELTTISWDLD